ncbi:MAG: hypothetical protein MUF06_21460, partial [Pirellulaceae bacterium]|nr:hypothetical protein [Pirellulaceae bacterium]
MAPLLSLAGVKTWKEFVRNAQCLSLEATDDQLRLVPCRNLGATRGFEPMPDKAIEAPLSPSEDQIGTAVTDSLA